MRKKNIEKKTEGPCPGRLYASFPPLPVYDVPFTPLPANAAQDIAVAVAVAIAAAAGEADECLLNMIRPCAHYPPADDARTLFSP